MKFKQVVAYVPIATIVPVLLYWLYFKCSKFPQLENLTDIDESNSSSIELAVDQISNANEFLVSLLTALFGLCGYFLNKHKNQLSFLPLAVVYFGCLVLLGLAYYSAFNVYTALINSIGQGKIALVPEESSCLYYVEEEFILVGGTSIVLLSILIVIFLNSTKLKLN